MAFKVGQKVYARRANNALGTYFPCQITAATSRQDVTMAHPWAEWDVLFRNVCHFVTVGHLCKRIHFYDVVYDDDGQTEEQVPEDRVSLHRQ